MILGRAPELFYGAIMAGVLLLVAFNVPITAKEVGAIGAFALAVLGLIANRAFTGTFLGRWDEGDLYPFGVPVEGDIE